MKSWLKDNGIEMYSTHNKAKSVAAEIFITTLKNKIYKNMTSISKNVYINKLDNIVIKYNSTYHITLKMKPVDVKSNTYTDFNKENNKKDIKFKFRIMLEYQNIKVFLQNVTFQIVLKKCL